MFLSVKFLFKKSFLLALILPMIFFTACKSANEKTNQETPRLIIESVTHNSITVAPVQGAEYSKDAGSTWQDSNIFLNLASQTEYKVTLRLKETSTHHASNKADAVSVITLKDPSLKDPQETPVIEIDFITDVKIVIKAVAGAEYSKDAGNTWQDSNAFLNLSPKTEYKMSIRLKETSTHYASAAAESLSVSTTYLTGFSVLENPEISFVAGENYEIIGGKIKLNYYNSDYFKEIDVTHEMVSLHFDKTLTISYMGFEKSTNFTSNLEITQINTVENLNSALLKTSNDKVLFINAGNYSIFYNSGTVNLYVRKNIVLIGFNDGENSANLILNDIAQLPGKTSLFFEKNTTLINLNFEIKKDKAPIKLACADSEIFKNLGRMPIDKVYIENIEVTGRSGINIQGVKNAVLKNSKIKPDSNIEGVAISAAETALTIENCEIGLGKWGSLGVMCDESVYDVSQVKINIINTSFESFIYAEKYSHYESVHGLGYVIFTGLEDWSVKINEEGQQEFTMLAQI